MGKKPQIIVKSLAKLKIKHTWEMEVQKYWNTQ